MLLLHSCVLHLGRLRETSEPGVRWSRGSSLNFELKLRHSASEKYPHSLCWDSRCQIEREAVIAFTQFFFI